jgi:hypothetical protein
MFRQHIAPNLKPKKLTYALEHNTWQLNDSDVQSQASLKKKFTSAMALRLATLLSEIQN